MPVSLLHANRSVRWINAQIVHRDTAWYLQNPRTAPERQLRVPLVRENKAEQLAREFFANVARDSELLIKRAGVLYAWFLQRPSMRGVA